jgi:hypothetical protein
LAFGIFYTLLRIMGIADHSSGATQAAYLRWSLMTARLLRRAPSGRAFLARIGVGIGGRRSPPAFSLLDSLRPAGNGLSIFSMGIFVGSGLASSSAVSSSARGIVAGHTLIVASRVSVRSPGLDHQEPPRRNLLRARAASLRG